MSDAIEMKVRYWLNVRNPYGQTLICRIAGFYLYILAPDGMMARVDGGDPGDEDEAYE